VTFKPDFKVMVLFNVK